MTCMQPAMTSMVRHDRKIRNRDDDSDRRQHDEQHDGVEVGRRAQCHPERDISNPRCADPAGCVVPVRHDAILARELLGGGERVDADANKNDRDEPG